MSLTTSIKNMLSTNDNNFYPNDSSWVKFVKDHRDQILENSSTVTIDSNNSYTHRYSLETYLKSIKVASSMSWIIIWLNQLDTPMNFNGEITELIIPTHEFISSLQSNYAVVKAMRTKRGVYND